MMPGLLATLWFRANYLRLHSWLIVLFIRSSHQEIPTELIFRRHCSLSVEVWPKIEGSGEGCSFRGRLWCWRWSSLGKCRVGLGENKKINKRFISDIFYCKIELKWFWFLTFFYWVHIHKVFLDFYIYPILQRKKGQNKPGNHQNLNLAKITPKSDKFMK